MSAKPTLPKDLPLKNDIRAILAYSIRVARVTKGWSQEALAIEPWRLLLPPSQNQVKQ